MITTTNNNKVTVEFDIGSYNKDIIDFLTVMEIANKSKATNEEVDNLANEIKKEWWENNKKRLLNETGN